MASKIDLNLYGAITEEQAKTLVKNDLQCFLQLRNKATSGNKPELFQRVLLYRNLTVDKQPGEYRQNAAEDVDIFLDSVRSWNSISSCSQADIPIKFTISSIVNFLSSFLSPDSWILPDDSDDENGVDTGTKKPVVKGRLMYMSEKVHLAQFCSLDSHLLFRAEVEASMKKSLTRRPHIAISKDGSVSQGKCDCVQAADQRCCHVAVLLYLVEDLALGMPPKIWTPCTSRPKQWGKGAKRAGDPSKLNTNLYKKKLDTERYERFDPRPTSSSMTTVEEKDAFLESLQKSGLNSMWERLLKYDYKDYELDEDRMKIIKSLVAQFYEALADQLLQYGSDPWSTSKCVHISGTERQSFSDLWFYFREHRITASAIRDWAIRPMKKTADQWNIREPKSLNNVQSIAWGKENEEKARKEYEKRTGYKVEVCGFFVSKEYPCLGASPDGLVLSAEKVVEIKCPWVLKDFCPEDLSKLSQKQRTAFCSSLDSIGRLKLKKSHQYFCQIQTQMFVTGRKKADFII